MKARALVIFLLLIMFCVGFALFIWAIAGGTARADVESCLVASGFVADAEVEFEFERDALGSAP